jgi:hypothetical protein
LISAGRASFNRVRNARKRRAIVPMPGRGHCAQPCYRPRQQRRHNDGTEQRDIPQQPDLTHAEWQRRPRQRDPIPQPAGITRRAPTVR